MKNNTTSKEMQNQPTLHFFMSFKIRYDVESPITPAPITAIFLVILELMSFEHIPTH